MEEDLAPSPEGNPQPISEVTGCWQLQLTELLQGTLKQEESRVLQIVCV